MGTFVTEMLDFDKVAWRGVLWASYAVGAGNI
jgi:hypothetical protein